MLDKTLINSKIIMLLNNSSDFEECRGNYYFLVWKTKRGKGSLKITLNFNSDKDLLHIRVFTQLPRRGITLLKTYRKILSYSGENNIRHVEQFFIENKIKVN